MRLFLYLIFIHQSRYTSPNMNRKQITLFALILLCTIGALFYASLGNTSTEPSPERPQIANVSHRVIMPNVSSVASVDSLLNSGIRVDAIDKVGNTLLLSYLLKGHQDTAIIQHMIHKGFSVNHRNKTGRTPLMIACMKQRYDAIYLLLKNGADAAILDAGGNQALNYSISTETLFNDKSKELFKTLLTFGNSINHKNNQGKTVLWHMIALNKLDFALWAMKEHELDPGVLDLKLENALFHPIFFKIDSTKLSELIHYGLDITQVNRKGLSLLTYFTKMKKSDSWGQAENIAYNISLLQYFIEILPAVNTAPQHSLQERNTQFLSAIEQCNLNTVRQLLTQSVTMDYTDMYGYSPFMYISLNRDVGVRRYKHAPITVLYNSSYQQSEVRHERCSDANKTKLFKVLLEKGYNPRTRDIYGNTLLHHYTANNDTALVDLLMTIDFEVNAFNTYLGTAAHYAIAHGYFNLFDKLRNYGIDLNQFKDGGATYLHSALMVSDSLFKSLIRDGLDINGQEKYELNGMLHYWVQKADTVMVPKLLALDADPNIYDIYGETPLWYGVKTGKTHHVISLLKAGAHINIINSIGQTEYDFASAGKQESILRYLDANGGVPASKLHKRQ